jgi:hypothetical protein
MVVAGAAAGLALVVAAAGLALVAAAGLALVVPGAAGRVGPVVQVVAS